MTTPAFLSSRNIGLDFLRAILILEGVLYHAARSLPGGNSWYYVADKNPSLIFSSLIEFIHTFRMEAFFFLSGMFSAMVFLRKGQAFFFENRRKRVLVPLIAAFAFIPGIMYWLSTTIKGVDTSTSGLLAAYTQLHHLWFLVSLSAISFFVPARLYQTLAIFARRLPFTLWLAALIIAANSLFVVKFAVKDLGELITLIPVTARFCVYYAAGYALYLNRDAIPQLAKHPLLNTAVVTLLAIICYIAFFLTMKFNLQGVAKYIPVLLSSVFSVIFSYWVIFFFEKLRMKESRIVNTVVDSALVVYILHYPIAIGFAWLLDDYLPDNYPVSYVLIVTAIASGLSALCYMVIKRNSFLSTLFGLKAKPAKALASVS
ncbi:acyltransferase family protein [Pantoea brenneri]|uniref:acyltransferase family protein n=1 Tax=Pantoea brenneri TaxID=472694 RepID=UPI0028A10F89|nr:acyltransferase family protein [Pantoea brenneri]